MEGPEEVVRLEARVKTWRRSRSRGARIPERIWEEATSLAERYGVCRVARGAGLGYASLRARMEAPCPRTKFAGAPPARHTWREVDGGVDRMNTEAAPAFIDLGFSMTSGLAELEVRARDGAVLTVRMPLGGSDLGPLVTAFLGASA